MRRKDALPELLSPAGDFDALVAAVAGGADAVYVGGKSFGARAFAKNFDDGELSLAVRYCHLHGVRLYVTVNTLVYDRELSALSDYAAYLYKIGVDAIIAADLGAIREIRRRVPKMEIHASTQMSVHNLYGVAEALSLGATRVVPARELTLENIKKIVDGSDAEVEIFLHGALCVCHSGQCLMSSLVGGRSGNRGECAQPCRLPYNGGGYPLSLKDLSLAEHIPEIIESGVASLKIEGRMKSSEYVYRVTKIYRRLLDEGRAATAAECSELRRIFSRDGFTDGYFVGRTEKGMTGVRSEEDKATSRSEQVHEIAPERVRVSATARIVRGERASLTLTDGKREITVYGDVPDEARSQPLDGEGVRARLAKMGNTLLSLSADDIALTLDEGLNLSPSRLNALRRDAADAFESCERDEGDIAEPYSGTEPVRDRVPFRTCMIFKPEVYSTLSAEGALSDFDAVFIPLETAEGVEEIPNGVAIPPVIFDTECPQIEKMLESAVARGARYALVSNIGAIPLARRYSLIPVGDFRLNITNSASREAYREMGVEHAILSAELTAAQARDIGGSVITLGRIPLMITERCFMRDLFGCRSCSDCYLTDRTGARFPMMRAFRHRNIIFNSQITYMGDRREQLGEARLSGEHLILSSESADEARQLLRAYRRAAPLPYAVRRLGVRRK